MEKEKLSFARQLAYACGMMGWSIMINLISVILIYLYLPPDSSGLPKLITQIAVFGFFNVIAIVTAGGRLIDAVYRPVYRAFQRPEQTPERSTHSVDAAGCPPFFIFCFFRFFPIKQEESVINIVWLTLMLIGFYVSTTTYIIPYNALLPELAPDAQDKVRLSTWQSVGYVFGIGIASNAFNLTDFFVAHLSFRIQDRCAPTKCISPCIAGGGEHVRDRLCDR